MKRIIAFAAIVVLALTGCGTRVGGTRVGADHPSIRPEALEAWLDSLPPA
jgi:hypothetical protein